MKNKGCSLMRPLMLKAKSSENFLSPAPKVRSGVRKFQFLLQKAHLCVNPRRLSHFAWKLVRGCGLQVGSGKKVKKVTNIVYFTYLPRSPRWSDRHQICFGSRFPGGNQLCQISFQFVQGFWFCRGSKFGLSHRNEVSPLTQGLNYRSACDVF